MNKKINVLLSLALTLAITLSSVSVSIARDEGMYMPDRVAMLDLRKKGLRIRPEEIYNPNGGGLTEAVVRLSIGCTAEFVSPEGLILTNHHCAFDALVSASTPDRDLVEHGFKADNRGGEFPAKGYSVFITERVMDLTADIRRGTESLAGEALSKAITANIEAREKAEQAKAPEGSQVQIRTMNNGYFHYLFQTRQIKDIRVVYAPPRNIGVFGGDPDNFEWTRHTGDFTFLRAYVGPDGKAADYSPNNVPYKPSRFLTMNIGGLKDGEFVFVLGYPGGTVRYRESQSIEYARDVNFPFLWNWLAARADALRLVGDSDEKKRIDYQSDVANFDNARKVYEGGEWRLRRNDVVEQRVAEEQRFAAWINADPARRQKYGSVLQELEAVSQESNVTAQRDVIVRRIPDATTPVFREIYRAANQTEMLPDEKRAENLEAIRGRLEGREPIYEREMLKFFFKAIADLPGGQKIKWFEDRWGSLSAAERRDAEAEFADSIATGAHWTPESLGALYGPRTMDYRPERDDPIAMAKALGDARADAEKRAAVFGSKIDRLRLLYQQGLSEFRGITPYPDANSTIRFTYGNVKGYSPREAEFRTPFTSIKGMIEKDTGINPFDMPQKLKDLQAAKDFGRFGSGDSVVVNFISTNDIIGGNSGSPVLNGRGEQVGLVFDGNYEGLGNDYYYDPNMNRSISVDIRFVLFVTEKVGGAGWILDEMKIVGK
jgi:hypothetical protein